MDEMFCFQCQQTAHNTGCEGKAGVCGKKADTANEQDRLTSALVCLSKAVKSCKKTKATDELMLEGLFTTITNVSFNTQTVGEQIKNINAETENILSKCKECTDCKCDFDIKSVWETDENTRSLKSLILFGLRGMAAYAYHAFVLGFTDDELMNSFYESLCAIADETDGDKLLSAVMYVGEMNYKCMKLLDKAHTESFGNPEPTKVPLMIEKGPFIVISGHDMLDMKLLLEQTKDKGINIYTHGEMLPAHGYPKLKAYKHLKGNFGTAWQSQQSEFHNIPAPILFTTNCLMPVRQSYCDRVFTTAVVSYPEIVHIGKDKDFTPVIEKALECGGYDEDHPMTGINGGDTVMTGFAHNTVETVLNKVVDLVKAGKIRHIFLVGGCDGAAPGRSYYTEFVKQTPPDTIVLTLACGKFRFNDLDLGDIEGLPRIMDMGQCNDSYSAIYVALALADVFKCSVNDLPLTIVLSWYEQKAVAVLLSLLFLGIKNMYLGPTLPAFLSPDITDFLVTNYQLSPISTPEKDLEKILGEK